MIACYDNDNPFSLAMRVLENTPAQPEPSAPPSFLMWSAGQRLAAAAVLLLLLWAAVGWALSAP